MVKKNLVIELNYYSNDKKLKNSEIIAKQCISLPIDPNINKKKLNYIIDKINHY